MKHQFNKFFIFRLFFSFFLMPSFEFIVLVFPTQLTFRLDHRLSRAVLLFTILELIINLSKTAA